MLNKKDTPRQIYTTNLDVEDIYTHKIPSQVYKGRFKFLNLLCYLCSLKHCCPSNTSIHITMLQIYVFGRIY